MADPQLLVALEARLDKFEKQLKEAGIIAEREIKAIEAQFAKMELTPGKLAGGVAGGQLIFRALEKGIEAFIDKVQEAINAMTRLNDVMEKTGVTSEQFQQVRFVGIAAGLDDKTILRDIERMAVAFDEMNNRQTELGRILEQNNIKYKEANGRVVDVNKQWEIAAELASKAVGPFQIEQVAKLLNVSEQWVLQLRQGVAAFQEMKAKAPTPEIEAGQKALNELLVTARLVRAAFSDWGLPLVTEVMPTLVKIGDAITFILEGIARVTKTGVLEETTQALLDRWIKIRDTIAEAHQQALKITVTKPAGPGLNLAPERQTDSIDKQVDALEKHIAVMKADAAAVGLNANEQEQFRVIALLTEAAIKAGVTVTDELAEKFVQLSERAGAAKQRLEELRATQAELNSASKELGSALADAFKEAALQGKKLDEVLKNLANRMASRAIDKLFDLFFGTRGGQGTSLFNSLLGITARQAGGPLRGGQAALVGESGPELFVPKTGGMVIPNSAIRSGGGAVEVKIINNTGQPVAEQERQGPNGRVLEITIGRLVRETINADLFSGGDVDRAMRTRFGLTPRLA